MAKDNIEQKQHLIDLMNMENKENIIDKWLKENGNPEIEKQVENEYKEIMKETAVEWLEQQLFNKLGKFTKGDIEHAKELEKQQIIEAHIQGHNAPSSTIKIHDAEQYYNETFKK